MARHNTICDWLQLDPAHYGVTEIEALEEEQVFGNYRITFLDGSVSDWKFTFDPDTGGAIDGYCYQDVI